MDVILDCNLIQHVASPTRIIPGQASNILDLIITPSLTDVDDVQFLSPIGHSDHLTLSFTWSKGAWFSEVESSYRNVWKTDFDGLLSAAGNMVCEIPPDYDVDQSWHFLKSKLQ